jgi:hypothetical protein
MGHLSGLPTLRPSDSMLQRVAVECTKPSGTHPIADGGRALEVADDAPHLLYRHPRTLH